MRACVVRTIGAHELVQGEHGPCHIDLGLVHLNEEQGQEVPEQCVLDRRLELPLVDGPARAYTGAALVGELQRTTKRGKPKRREGRAYMMAEMSLLAAAAVISSNCAWLMWGWS